MKSQIVGIDPGTHTGFAWIKDGQIMDVSTRDFWDSFFQIQRFLDPTQTVVVVEAGGMNKPTFDKGYVDLNNVKSMNKISRNTGGANREADLLAIGLEKIGFEVVRVRPTKRKWDSSTCKAITNYAGRTNEHSRDALRLAWDYLQTSKLERRIKK